MQNSLIDKPTSELIQIDPGSGGRFRRCCLAHECLVGILTIWKTIDTARFHQRLVSYQRWSHKVMMRRKNSVVNLSWMKAANVIQTDPSSFLCPSYQIDRNSEKANEMSRNWIRLFLTWRNLTPSWSRLTTMWRKIWAMDLEVKFWKYHLLRG